MQPLPLRAAADIFRYLALPGSAGLQLWVSCFEIYGGKLFDLLNSRQQLVMREDGKGRVCIVGLKEVRPWALENWQVSEILDTTHWVSAMSGYYATHHGLLPRT
jgi:hypothetical protein